MPYIALTDPDGGVRKLPLTGAPFSIGKLRRNDLCLSGELISREHVTLIPDAGGGCRLRDLDSRNGTFIGSERVCGEIALKDGETFRVGPYRITYFAGALEKAEATVQPGSARQDAARMTSEEMEAVKLRRRIHEGLLRELDLRRTDLSQHSPDEIRRKTGDAVRKIVAGIESEIPRRIDRERLIKDVLDEALGLGPLEDLLADPEIDEIMVNSWDKIYIERKGKIVRSDKRFTDNYQVVNVIRRIIAPIGRRIDESSPMVDARLADGSRVNAIIAPLALTGPTLTIRKFSADPFKVDDLLSFGTMNQIMAQFLRHCVQYRKNCIISGGTGSGKTTLLNVLSSFIPDRERIVSIEDAAELKLGQEHVVSLEAKPPNIEGEGAIPIRKLVINALRMRPDRIIVGEARGGEALDMLQAMNTGHDGSLTTIHANSSRDALSRLETLVLMAGMELPSRAIREQISAAIDIIVQTARLSDGSRKVTSITELTGMEGDTFKTQDIYVFRQTGFRDDGAVIGEFVTTGNVPTFAEEWKERGLPVDYTIFQPARVAPPQRRESLPKE
ncbi:MAG TPA: ATPase, T2SS/T4P/T4SS family [Candidatus Brocadiia bacterium]|nr:ATPase, T2SS/T4P/T4SS family [Candidatus Brocadiia bacterium]